MKTMIISNG